MQRWQTPSGEYITGKLPDHIKGHYDIGLVRYILYQYYHADVTQPLILEQLLEFGIDISSGQV
ncbi:MAG: transposase, partial [Dissulfuribacterales bacterium]